MTSHKTASPSQLPLPFHLPVTASLSEREREMLKQVLAQLLLEAACMTQEGSNDGRS